MKGLSYTRELPTTGHDKDWVIKEVEIMLGLGEFKAETGAFSGICHKPKDERVEVVTRVYSMAAYTNPLNPDAYPGIHTYFHMVRTLLGEIPIFYQASEKWRPKL